jgi:hypothetical protein
VSGLDDQRPGRDFDDFPFGEKRNAVRGHQGHAVEAQRFRRAGVGLTLLPCESSTRDNASRAWRRGQGEERKGDITVALKPGDRREPP